MASEINEDSTLEEVATLVCAGLEADGISVVLSGGAAVSIYSDNPYESYDLDFVPTGLARRVDRAMHGSWRSRVRSDRRPPQPRIDASRRESRLRR